MEPDYDSICRKAQQSIDRGKGRIAELAATVDETQGLLDALNSSRAEVNVWKQKYNEEHQKRLIAEENLAAERERPQCYMDRPNIEQFILGDKNIYAENNSLEGLPNQRISLGQ